MAFVEHRSLSAGIVPFYLFDIMHEGENHASALIWTHMEAPVLPSHLVAVDLETGAERLADVQGAGNLAHRIAGFAVVLRFGRRWRRGAFVHYAQHGFLVEVHHRR